MPHPVCPLAKGLPILFYLLTDNILFTSKIAGNLKAAGIAVKAVASPAQLDSALADGRPVAVLVNLNARGYDPVKVIKGLKAADPPHTVIAFCGHADKATYEIGLASGADRVVANSAITMNAAQVLRDAGVL